MFILGATRGGTSSLDNNLWFIKDVLGLFTNMVGNPKAFWWVITHLARSPLVRMGSVDRIHISDIQITL